MFFVVFVDDVANPGLSQSFCTFFPMGSREVTQEPLNPCLKKSVTRIFASTVNGSSSAARRKLQGHAHFLDSVACLMAFHFSNRNDWRFSPRAGCSGHLRLLHLDLNPLDCLHEAECDDGDL
jgi:hypothetical protein